MATDNTYQNLGSRVRVGDLLVQGSLLGVNLNASNKQSFIYVATGSEGAAFVVALPTSMPSTNYGARASGAGMAAFLEFDAPTATLLVDRFTLVCSAAPTAGDKILITVESLS